MEIGSAVIQSWMRQGSSNTYKKSGEVAVYSPYTLEEESMETAGNVFKRTFCLEDLKSLWDRTSETTLKVPRSFEELRQKTFFRQEEEVQDTADSDKEKGKNVTEAVLPEKEEEETDYHKFIQEKIAEIYEKLKNGETEEEFSIGSASFTIREWDEFLAKFDSEEDAIKAAMEERLQKQKEKVQKTREERADMLYAEVVVSKFKLQGVRAEGKPPEDIYLTAIDINGIRCCKAGTDGYEWEIKFTDESQYRMAKEFLDWAGEHMDNFLFASHKNFWEDFLGGTLDVEAFKGFLEGTENGIPNYGIGDETYMRIDVEKVKWAKYMNPHGATFYTAQDFKIPLW